MVTGALVLTEAETIARAAGAARLLADPLLNEALSLIETEIIEAFHACPVRDTDGMRILQTNLRMARQFKGVLQGAIERGKLAASDLMAKESFADKTRGVFARLR